MAYDSKQLQKRANITARQMDHWYRRGWLVTFERLPQDGSGTPIEWPERTVRKAVLMGHLVRSGFRPEKANQIAEHSLKRKVVSYPLSVRVGDHILVTILAEG
jgi:hypothetical protein